MHNLLRCVDAKCPGYKACETRWTAQSYQSLQKSVKDVPEWTDRAYQRKKKVTLALWMRLNVVWKKKVVD